VGEFSVYLWFCAAEKGCCKRRGIVVVVNELVTATDLSHHLQENHAQHPAGELSYGHCDRGRDGGNNGVDGWHRDHPLKLSRDRASKACANRQGNPPVLVSAPPDPTLSSDPEALHVGE
jgi:hypothetical protein